MKTTTFAVLAAVLLALPSVSRAVIFYDTGSTTFHTTAPSNSAQAALWELEGAWGDFTGTPISSNMFITAQHIGMGVGNTITFGSGPDAGTYTATAVYNSPFSDLRIVQISGTFASWVPLVSSAPSINDDYIVFGRGTQRGAAYGSPVQKGWLWGTADHVMRYGTGTLGGTITSDGKTYLYDTFGGAGTVALSTGDSSGGLFVNDGGTWKLAAINYAVSGPYSETDPGTAFNASLYNQTGLYTVNGSTYTPASGPGAFFSTSIYSDEAWIASVVPEPSAGALLLGGAVLLGLYRLRSRKRRA